jgi:hypothetical protein
MSNRSTRAMAGLPAERKAFSQACILPREKAPLDQHIRRTTMLNNPHVEWRQNRVTVAFADGPLSFLLSKDATFEDLADRLDRLGERHHGKPIAISVKLAAAPDTHRQT